jgi:hypothetical protein
MRCDAETEGQAVVSKELAKLINTNGRVIGQLGPVNKEKMFS